MQIEKLIFVLHMRLSQEDERAEELLSIENKRRVLRKYAEDNGLKSTANI